MRHVIWGIALIACGCASTEVVTTTPVSLSLPQVAAAKGSISQQLKDPYSAQYRSEAAYSTSSGGVIACGEVNARNSFGGYSGFSWYYVRIKDGAIVSRLIDETGQRLFFPARDACALASRGSVSVRST